MLPDVVRAGDRLDVLSCTGLDFLLQQNLQQIQAAHDGSQKSSKIGGFQQTNSTT